MNEVPKLNELGWLAIKAGMPVGSFDPFADLGLGPETPPRLRELVGKGLYYEHRQDLEFWDELVKRKGGRPRVPHSKDFERAFFLHWMLKHMPEDQRRAPWKIGDLIEYAIQLQALQVEANRWPADKRVFDTHSTLASLRSSVSKGLKELGITKEQLWKNIALVLPESFPRRFASLCTHLQRCGGRNGHPTSQVSVRPLGRGPL